MREEARQLVDEIKQILREETGHGGRMDAEKFKSDMKEAAMKAKDYGRSLKIKYDAMDGEKKKRLWAMAAGVALIALGTAAIAKNKKRCHCGDDE